MERCAAGEESFAWDEGDLHHTVLAGDIIHQIQRDEYMNSEGHVNSGAV